MTTGLAAALPAPAADAWLAVDLTHLALDVDPTGAADRLASIASVLPPGRRIQVGAEDAARTDAVLDCVRAVAARGLADRLGATVQANVVRSTADLDSWVATGVHIRLVKGAYVKLRHAPLFGEATDIAYLRLAFRLAHHQVPWSMATHDGRLREALLLALGSVQVEQLLGVRPDVLADCAIGRSRPGSTFPTARTGFATGCDASPSREAPETSLRVHLNLSWCGRLPQGDANVLGHGFDHRGRGWRYSIRHGMSVVADGQQTWPNE